MTRLTLGDILITIPFSKIKLRPDFPSTRRCISSRAQNRHDGTAGDSDGMADETQQALLIFSTATPDARVDFQ